PIYGYTAYHRRPGLIYRPYYAVPTTSLVTALFVRRDLGHYYFGDYFETRYVRSGYVPWVDYTVARNVPNPLFSFYARHQGRERITELRQTYVGRQEGRLPRPAVTVKQQIQLVQNITVNKTINVNNQTIRVENPATVVK